MRRSRAVVAFVTSGVVALAVAVGAWADAGLHGPPTSIGTGGAATTVDTLATQAAIDALRSGGTPSTPRWSRQRCSASPSRSHAASAAAASW